MVSASTVLVYEFFTGGGCPEGQHPGALATEALGMLWAVLEDFRCWGTVRTITALDPRFETIVPGLNRDTLPADKVVCAFPGEHEEFFLSLFDQCDAALIIAPETDDILARLTEQAEAAGKPVLGSSSSAIASAGNKATCSRLWDLARLPSPMTRTASFDSAHHVASMMGCPLVVKPLDGVGCEGVCKVNCLSDLPFALELIRQTTAHEQILLQSFAEGIPASASLLVSRDRCLPLSLNLQLMEAGLPFKYLGSHVPMLHPACNQAMDLACSAVKRIPGLKGYVGVDLVLQDDAIQLIEINPRLTTSYLALRQVARNNLAQAIWEACMVSRLPDQVLLEGQVTIKRDDPATWGRSMRSDSI